MRALNVLSSGVDTLNLSVRGVVRASLWDLLEEAKTRAQAEEDPVPFALPVSERCFLVRSYGWRGYRFWLTSPDLELMLGRIERFPAVLVQLHSACLHSLGVARALDLVELVLRADLLAAGPDTRPELVTSRVDLYADAQGWDLELGDFRRFVGYGRHRRGFDQRQEVFLNGNRLTGFVFGKDQLVARIYDKTAEIGRRGLSWLPELWSEGDPERPVWRIEFQYRRELLSEFGLRVADEVIAAKQDLWRYATDKWLTFRVPTGHSVNRRWPVDPIWSEVQAIEIDPVMVGVIRQRQEEAAEDRLLVGLGGYLSSLGALWGAEEPGTAWGKAAPRLERYWASRGLTFGSEVGRKRARQLSVSGPTEVAS